MGNSGKYTTCCHSEHRRRIKLVLCSISSRYFIHAVYYLKVNDNSVVRTVFHPLFSVVYSEPFPMSAHIPGGYRVVQKYIEILTYLEECDCQLPRSQIPKQRHNLHVETCDHISVSLVQLSRIEFTRGRTWNIKVLLHNSELLARKSVPTSTPTSSSWEWLTCLVLSGAVE